MIDTTSSYMLVAYLQGIEPEEEPVVLSGIFETMDDAQLTLNSIELKYILLESKIIPLLQGS